MLKGISPLLNADVLYALKSMGHGDMLAVVDTNFPAESVASQTVLGELLRIDNVSSAEAVAAILSLMRQEDLETAKSLASRIRDAGARDALLAKLKTVMSEDPDPTVRLTARQLAAAIAESPQ